MALTKVTLPQLTEILNAVISAMETERPETQAIFRLMYNTGLRANEALEVDRWTVAGTDSFEVQLSKDEGTRIIPYSSVPDSIIENYKNKVQYIYQTYSSINNTFKRFAPGFIINEDTRRTTSHIMRYRYMQQLKADGLSIAEIAVVMGHINTANTAKYVSSDIYAGLG